MLLTIDWSKRSLCSAPAHLREGGSQQGDRAAAAGGGNGGKPEHKTSAAGRSDGVPREREQLDSERKRKLRDRAVIHQRREPRDHLETRARTNDLELIAELGLQRAEQGLAPLRVEQPHAAQVAREVALGDEVAKRQLRQDRHVAVKDGQ